MRVTRLMIANSDLNGSIVEALESNEGRRGIRQGEGGGDGGATW